MAGSQIAVRGVHAKAGHTVEPGLVGGQFLQQRLDRVPHRCATSCRAAGPVPARRRVRDATGRSPTDTPESSTGLALGEIVVLPGEHPARTGRFGAAPGPLAPGQLDRPGHAWHVDQPHLPPAVAVRDHSADRAALFPGWRLDHDPERRSTLGLVLADVSDVEAGQTDQQVAVVDVISIGACRNTRRRLGHCRGLPVEELGRSRSSGGLGPFPASSLPRVAHTPPTAGKKSRDDAVSADVRLGTEHVMTQNRRGRAADEPEDAQVSQGPSSLAPAESSGGADAVPETPDNVPDDHPVDVDRGGASTAP